MTDSSEYKKINWMAYVIFIEDLTNQLSSGTYKKLEIMLLNVLI